jgi:hypothetical protein
MIVLLPIILRPSLIEIDHVAARLRHHGTGAECQNAAMRSGTASEVTVDIRRLYRCMGFLPLTARISRGHLLSNGQRFGTV